MEAVVLSLDEARVRLRGPSPADVEDDGVARHISDEDLLAGEL